MKSKADRNHLQPAAFSYFYAAQTDSDEKRLSYFDLTGNHQPDSGISAYLSGINKQERLQRKFSHSVIRYIVVTGGTIYLVTYAGCALYPAGKKDQYQFSESFSKNLSFGSHCLLLDHPYS
jgi:hypothetical protein